MWQWSLQVQQQGQYSQSWAHRHIFLIITNDVQPGWYGTVYYHGVFCFSPIVWRPPWSLPLKIKWVPLHKPLLSTNHEADIAVLEVTFLAGDVDTALSSIQQWIPVQGPALERTGVLPIRGRGRDGWRGRWCTKRTRSAAWPRTRRGLLSVLSWNCSPPPQLKLPKDISCYQAVTGSETQT